MALFKSKYERELDAVISRMEMNMSNNYKDVARENLKELECIFQDFLKNGKLKDKQKAYYESRIEIYREKMKGFSHKDQKPYWT